MRMNTSMWIQPIQDISFALIVCAACGKNRVHGIGTI